FLAAACDRAGIRLPAERGYGAGCVFLPTDPAQRAQVEALFEKVVKEEGQRFLGWRDVPTDNSTLGPTARKAQPFLRQVFIGRNTTLSDDLAFERKLYVIRRRVENAVKASDLAQRGM